MLRDTDFYTSVEKNISELIIWDLVRVADENKLHTVLKYVFNTVRSVVKSKK